VPCRPYPLTGIVTVPDDAHGLVVVCSTVGSQETATLIASIEQDVRGPGLAMALFDDLLPARSRSDPLSAFDVNVVAARLLAAVDVLATHPQLQQLCTGCLGLGGGAAAAVIAASERPGAVQALVLSGDLVAASTSLPLLRTPSLYLRAAGERSDCGFVATRSRGTREVRWLPGGRARGTSASVAVAAAHARRWFERHLVFLH
jgi:hypothetical protein